MNLISAEKGNKHLARGIVARILAGLATWLVIISIVMLNVIPQRHVLKAGDIAPENIKATHDVVDTLSTNKKVQDAVANVQDKYKQDDAVTTDVLNKLVECYNAMDSVRSKGNDEIKKLGNNTASAAYKDGSGIIQFTEVFLEQCHTLLPGTFTDEDVRYIIVADGKKLSALEDKVTELMTQALKSGIKEEYLQNSVQTVSQELINPLNRFEDSAQRLGMNLISSFLQANFIFDQEATDAAKKKAAADVQPEMYKQGQLIVQQGLPVTEQEIQVLSDLGLLDENNPHLLMYLGVGVFTGLLLLILWLYVLFFEPEVFFSFRKLLLLNIIFVLTLAIMWLGRSVHYYFLLSTAGVLMIAVLINSRLAFTVNALLALFTGIIAGSDGSGAFTIAALPAAVAALASGSVALFVTRRTPHRSALMLAGILSGIMSAAVLVAIDLVSAQDWQVMLKDLGAGLGGGVVSSMICLGLLPLWEIIFKVVTPMRLLELANPNHPLLKRLLIEAPGTYHHSIIVGNLAESAAEAVGANALMTRTGAYYHDVGKLLRPYFFTENQIVNESPHESIAPELSKRILTAHAKDGVELAAKYGLPQQVQDIIQEHHGTTPVMYFYHKAVKTAKEDETVSLDDYRYAGPKPHTREAAIIMLADSIEAGARSLQEHSQEKLDEFVQHIVNVKLEDGQFDNCDLTLRDIGIISSEFRKVLGGIFHERVVYPTTEPQKKGIGSQW